MKKETSPTSNYNKMRELLKINDCNTDIMYVDRETIMNDLNFLRETMKTTLFLYLRIKESSWLLRLNILICQIVLRFSSITIRI